MRAGYAGRQRPVVSGVGRWWHARGVEQGSLFGRTVLVTGPESLLAERAVSSFTAKALEQRPDATLVRLPAGGLDSGSLTEAAGGSLFAADTILVIENLGELPAEVADQLVSLAADPGPELALALVHAGGNLGKAVLDRVRKLKLQTVDCPTIKPWDLPQFVTAETRGQGGRIDAATAETLIQAVGSDARALAAAVRQLLDDTPDRVITETAVRRYFGGRAEVTSFTVAEDALAGRTDDALGKLRWALASGVAPVLVTSALATNLRRLGKYHHGRDRRASDAELTAALGVTPRRLRDISTMSRAWPPSAVSSAIRAVAQADAEVKGAASDPEFALEQLLLTVIGCRTR